MAVVVLPQWDKVPPFWIVRLSKVGLAPLRMYLPSPIVKSADGKVMVPAWTR